MTTSAAFFATPDAGHFARLCPLISGMALQGVTTYVFTSAPFKAEVEAAGGTFVDLFGKYPLERADSESVPFAFRWVSFAGHYADEILRDLEDLGPSLVVYDTFSVIGHVVGSRLGVPYVNVCSGHNMHPAWSVAHLPTQYPRVSASPGCLRAVETLRERYGLHDASPFSFLSGLSPFLNVYCEPSTYLTETERTAFEPVAFYGSLPSLEEIEVRENGSGPSCFGDSAELNVYVSFGTIVWRHWPDVALRALLSISEALGQMENVNALVSVGSADAEAASFRALRKPNVSVVSFADQWRVLQEADVFITHHGLNSTHEAIFHQVPMISYPFFADQPGLAKICRSFGLALPLNDSPLSPVTLQDVHTVFAELARSRKSMHASLATARGWELATIANRDAVHRQIARLLG